MPRLLTVGFALLLAAPLRAQDRPPVTPPKSHLGFAVGDDYHLANYKQLAAYWKKLEAESDRVKLFDIGPTEEGRRQLMAVVTSPANHKTLQQHQATARAMARGVIPEAEARTLAATGKAIVWIDGGLHASETLCAQVLIEVVHQFASRSDPETLRILDDVIILFVHANPDGHDLVADHYMKETDPKKRTLAGLPRLYQKYAGHDNNRDFYANTQLETKNMNRVMYREWLPQIVYNPHQSGPPGTVLFCPPFRDPFNYRIEPLAINGIDAVGAAMMQRFLAEGKPGATSRSGASYSTWYNGGLRTTSHFHNMIGLLTETIGSPTPMRIPLVPAKQLPKGDYLDPIPPQPWHFRQSVDYSLSAARAVLDYASRHREPLLFNIWRMGRNGIEAGNRDSWTVTPSVVAAAVKERADRTTPRTTNGGAEYTKAFRDPARRDPRGFVLPADQPDFLTATKFVNALLGTGVVVHRANAPFEIAGKKYAAGSYVVKAAQAFRPHVLDMFEPQDHPNDFAYPGAPPTRPYDTAGYTLAFQMGVRFDRLLDAIDGPFEEITSIEVAPPPGKVLDADGAVGFFLSGRTNDAFRAVNRLLKAGEEVRRLTAPSTVDGTKHPAGFFYVVRKPDTLPRLTALAAELGTRFVGSKRMPEAVPLKPVRVGLWDRYGGSMPSGWTRFVLERFEFPFEVVYPADLDKGNLRDRFDVLLFPDGAYSGRGAGWREPPKAADGGDAPAEPMPTGNRRGVVTAAATLPKLKEFVEAGGTLLAIGGSTAIGVELGVPVTNHLTTKSEKGEDRPLTAERFYVPASVLRTKLDPAHPLAWGLADEVDVMFASSPTFRLAPDSKASRVAWFDGKTPLRSGWAWGQEHLDGGTAIVDAKVGRGRVVLYGPQVLFRAQPHGSFRLVFNALLRAGTPDRIARELAPTPRPVGPPPIDLKAVIGQKPNEAVLVSRRYDVDRGSLGRAYPLSLSAGHVARMRKFHADWLAAVTAIDPEPLSVPAREELAALRAKVESALRELDAKAAADAAAAPLVPFLDSIIPLDEARRRMDPVDPVAAAGRLADLPKRIESAKAALKADGVTRWTATHAADMVGRLRSTLADWYAFHDGYDPLLTWWAAQPVKQADAALDAYAKFLADAAKGLPDGKPPTPVKPSVRPAGPSDAPDLEELLAASRSEFVPVLDRYQGGRGWRTWQPADRDPARWLTALGKLDFDKLSRDGQVDYILFRARLERERMRLAVAASARPPVPKDDTGIVGRPIGRAALMAELHGELIPYSPEELIALAKQELAWCEAELKQAAREMGLGDDWKNAVEVVKGKAVPPGGQPKLIRELATEAEQYLKTHALVTVPPLAAETWRMQMMTPERQRFSPFFTGGEVISVAYPTSGMSHDAKLQSMRGNNPHFSRATVHHELIPGHHLQQFMTAREKPHRQALGTSVWTEGWAVYWEMVLYARRFPASPEDRIGFLVWRPHRCPRVLFSFGYHLGQMTPRQCVDLLTERVGFEPDNAAAEVRRSFAGGYGPLYQAGYLIGAMQFRALRTELVETGRMSERAFHDAILNEGGIPIEMGRAILTGQPLTRDHNAGWRFGG